MIQEKYIIKSYAKINLHLEVLNKRKDNYHNLFSLMAELELSDLLKLQSFNLTGTKEPVIVEIINDGGMYSSVTDEIPCEKNLISIAVKNYMRLAGAGGNFRFSLEKNIPSGAGLGGGSSNAAAALVAATGALGRDIDDDTWKAASLTGSDVPFFLCGGFAFIEGRGELVSPAEFIDESYVLLVNNGIHVDTGRAYQSLNRLKSDILIDCRDRKELIREKINIRSYWKTLFKNDFEDTVFRMHPELAFIKEKMYNLNSFFAAMTGSGSTIFGLFENAKIALLAQSELEKDGNTVYFAKFLSRKN